MEKEGGIISSRKTMPNHARAVLPSSLHRFGCWYTKQRRTSEPSPAIALSSPSPGLLTIVCQASLVRPQPKHLLQFVSYALRECRACHAARGIPAGEAEAGGVAFGKLRSHQDARRRRGVAPKAIKAGWAAAGVQSASLRLTVLSDDCSSAKRSTSFVYVLSKPSEPSFVRADLEPGVRTRVRVGIL